MCAAFIMILTSKNSISGCKQSTFIWKFGNGNKKIQMPQLGVLMAPAAELLTANFEGLVLFFSQLLLKNILPDL